MARALRITFPGAFYHVTSRSNERKDIYKSKRDRQEFIEYLESAWQRYDALIHAYCLMDNHYHLLLETPCGNLPQIMRHINSAYTTYFNVKRLRSGHLFLLFFFQFSFFLWIKLGLFLLFPFAFVFFPFITHVCFSLFESLLHPRHPHSNALIEIYSSIFIFALNSSISSRIVNGTSESKVSGTDSGPL